MPFENLSEENNLQMICNGFSYDLQMELSRFRQFQIKSADFVQKDIARYEDFIENSDYLIRGSFRSYNNIVRINAQLLESKSNRLVWSERIEDNIDSLFLIQENLLQKLTVSLQQQLNIDLLSAGKRKSTSNYKAYQFWLYGFNELKKGSYKSDLKAREYFEKALEKDPEYSLACSGMSLTYFNEWSCQLWDRWELSQKGAKTWAEKALQLDDQNYIANLILGKVLLFEWNFDKAEIFLKKALHLNPNDPFNIIQIASSFVYLGFLDEAERLYLKALEINPLNEDHYHPVGALIYFEKGDFEKCISTGIKYNDMAWVDYPAMMAAAYFYSGSNEKAFIYWNQYLKAFEEKISKKVVSVERDALEWIMEINPYNYRSKYHDFWSYIQSSKKLTVEMSGLRKVENDNYYNVFKKKDNVWTFTYLKKTVQLTDAKGFGDIARLLENPGKQFHCNELIGGGIVEHQTEVFDEKAKREYQRKILELQEDIRSAEENNDSGQLTLFQHEYEQLLHHLESSLDLRGKKRYFQRSNDKARSAVTQRIKGSIKKFEKTHPELYKHLRLSVKTGNFCSYEPENLTIWEI